MSRDETIALLDAVLDLARRDACRTYFLPGWWRDMAVICQLIGEDGRIVADITPEEQLRISHVLGSHQQADPPPSAQEVLALEHQLYSTLFPGP